MREQARWKLERAVEMAVAAKRWDAAAVSSFALGELVGGDDSAAAVGALMLHQVRYRFFCRRGNARPTRRLIIIPVES